MGSTDVLFRATDIFPSGKSYLRTNIDTLYTRISELPYRIVLTAEELYLVIDEAISNAMEHGNGWDEKKEVTVTTVFDNENLTITIHDQGTGYFEIPEYNASDPLRSRRGRGLFLISRLCRLARNTLGNELRISIQRSEHHP